MRFFCKEFLEPVAYFIYAMVFCSLAFKNKERKYKMLFLYYSVVTVLMFTASIVDVMDGNNNFIYNFIYLLTNFIIGRYYYLTFEAPIKKKIVILACALSSFIFLYILVIKYNFSNIFNGYANGAIFLTIVIYCFLYFHQLLTSIKEGDLLHSFDFWICCSYLLYFLSAFFIIIYYESTDEYKRANLWILQSVILFISSLVLVRGRFMVAKST
jgi:hypothetical protein